MSSWPAPSFGSIPNGLSALTRKVADTSDSVQAAFAILDNVRNGNRRLQAVMRVNGAWQKAGHTRLQRWLILRDPDGLTKFRRWALSRPFVQISMAHGLIVQEDARECLYRLQRGGPFGAPH